MNRPDAVAHSPGRALWLSTAAFTVCFAVWTIFSIVGVVLKTQLQLTGTQFGLLVGAPVLTGSLVRMVLGIWTDRYGGRVVFPLTMLAAAVATVLLTVAQTYQQVLLAALGVGLAGGSFAIGVAYVSRFYPQNRQGTALGIFGIGNLGATVTTLGAPLVMLAWGWHSVALIWAAALVAMALIFWLGAPDDPASQEGSERGRPRKRISSQLAPLRDPRVWRFGLYYLCSFGAFVALTLWLPRYLIGVYGFDIKSAGLVTAAFSIPASLFRAYGGALADRMGARTIMYWTLGVSALAAFLLALPQADMIVHGVSGTFTINFAIGPWAFVGLVFVMGFFMSLGMAAVFKHIPTYYRDNVGAVGGLVGMIGGLGGVVLPLLFGWLNDATGLWSSCFMVLFALVVVSLGLMHAAVRRLSRASASQPA